MSQLDDDIEDYLSRIPPATDDDYGPEDDYHCEDDEGEEPE